MGHHSNALIDMTGENVNGILVVGRAEKKTGSTAVWWVCKCPYCGREFVRRGSDLRSGEIKSCGCKNRVPDPGRPFRKYATPEIAKKREKYGCLYCTEKCKVETPCKYADILDRYESYAEYDKEAKRFMDKLLHQEE